MTGYREIADSLRARIRAGEFPVGAKLPGIGALRAEYDGVALNTVRSAQQLLVREGMLTTRRGVGAFVASADPVDEVDVLAALRQAEATLARAIVALEAAGGPVPELEVSSGEPDVRGSGEDSDAQASRRTQLLGAACRVIARHGIRGLRIEAVAEEAGVSTALIYHHFGGRSGLITEAMVYINDRLAQGSEGSEVSELSEGCEVSGVTGRDTGMRRLLRRMTSEFGEDQQTRENSAVWGEVRGAAVFDERLRPISRDATEHWIEQLVELITEGRADGSITGGGPDGAHDVAVRLTATVEGLSNRWLAGLMSTEEAHRHITASVHAELTGID